MLTRRLSAIAFVLSLVGSACTGTIRYEDEIGADFPVHVNADQALNDADITLHISPAMSATDRASLDQALLLWYQRGVEEGYETPRGAFGRYLHLMTELDFEDSNESTIVRFRVNFGNVTDAGLAAMADALESWSDGHSREIDLMQINVEPSDRFPSY